MLAVEGTDVLGLHRANPFGRPARLARQRVLGPIDHVAHGAEHPVERVRRRAHHLVVDRPLLLEPERLRRRVLADAEVAHLAPDLVVRVVGVEQCIQLALDERVEGAPAGRRVEVVGRAPLLGEGVGVDQGGVLEAAARAPLRPLGDEQVLLRVRLALVGHREGVRVHEPLRHRLLAHDVEREVCALVDEARAHRAGGGVEVERRRTEAVDDLAVAKGGEDVARGGRRVLLLLCGGLRGGGRGAEERYGGEHEPRGPASDGCRHENAGAAGAAGLTAPRGAAREAK